MMPRLKGLIMLDDVNRGLRVTLCNANGPCNNITKYQLDLVRRSLGKIFGLVFCV